MNFERKKQNKAAAIRKSRCAAKLRHSAKSSQKYSQVPTQLLELLSRYDKILLTSHINPDGDAVGSCVALGWALRHLGKDVLLYNKSGFPPNLQWMTLPCKVLTSLEDLHEDPALPSLPSLIIALDSGDAERLGPDIAGMLTKVPTINIDHHLGNTLFGSAYNWVEPLRSAVGEMIGLLIEALGLKFDQAMAQAIYTAIVTDTGSFSFGNTTAESLRLTARLLDFGLDANTVREHLNQNWTEAKFRLWGRLTNETRILDDGKLAAVLVSQQMVAECGATLEDSDGFVDRLRNLREVRAGLLLKEIAPSQTKASLRSGGKDDVRAVALQFGGGGHRNAAGATLPLDLEKSLQAMLPRLKEIWQSNLP